MKITFLQTSDPIFYHAMLQETSRTVRAFCQRNGFSYESYTGIKRGHMPWQAAFNRIILLKEMLERGIEGWVFYLDADAYIADLTFDLRKYLSDKSAFGAIFAGYINDIPYDINSGGFAINISHPLGKGLICDYYDALMRIPTDAFDRAIFWDSGEIPNDQHLLHLILKRYLDDLKIGGSFLFERTNQSFVNNGQFIVQKIRSMYGSFDERQQSIRTGVGAVLSGTAADDLQYGDPGIYIPASHPRLKVSLAVKTPYGIRSTAGAGMIFYGPYIPLPPGRYEVRLLGELRMPHAYSVAPLAIDIVHDKGRTSIANQSVSVDRAVQGLLVTQRFVLDHAVEDLEVRLRNLAPVDLCVHALQIIPLRAT